MGRAATRKAKDEQKTLGQQMQRRRMLLQVKEEAREFAEGISNRTDPAEAVQAVLDHIYAAYQYATQQMFSLTEDEYWRETLGGRVPHEWIREQERLALQVVHIAGKASGMGLAERMVRIQEAQAGMFALVVDQVLKELGMGANDRHKAHELIAAKLEQQAAIEGTATEVQAA